MLLLSAFSFCRLLTAGFCFCLVFWLSIATTSSSLGVVNAFSTIMTRNFPRHLVANQHHNTIVISKKREVTRLHYRQHSDKSLHYSDNSAIFTTVPEQKQQSKDDVAEEEDIIIINENIFNYEMLATFASASEEQQVEQLNEGKEGEEIIIINQNLINRDIFAEIAATEITTTNLYKFNQETNMTVMIL